MRLLKYLRLSQLAAPIPFQHVQALPLQLRTCQILALYARLLLEPRLRHTPPPRGSMRTPTPNRAGSVKSVETAQLWTVETCAITARNQDGLGTSRSLCAISSIDTSRNVRTLALFTKRAGRYMSQTQASPMETS
jgi:hypothetical protein